MSDGIMLSIGDDGIAREYDDTYDITIHCESREEQEEVRKALENIPRWIQCSERLPKESGTYQVTTTRGNVAIYVFVADSISSHEYWKRSVTAWMPLPEPYKEVTE